ncbi:ABC transporter ATP-binding protein [Tessaracoccus sp.]
METSTAPLSTADHDLYLREQTPVLTAHQMSIDYEVHPPVHAVRDVSLVLNRGEILGLAGESGCGKTTLAYGINRLLNPPARLKSGAVTLHDQNGNDIDVTGLSGDELRAYRWDKVSMVFQGAMNALNPVIPVRAQLFDVFTTHRPGMSRAKMQKASEELLEQVGVDPTRLNSFAHELSGGMRQRVMIAMALALKPQVMIMDEPTTALDVVVQRGILREIMRLREQFNFAVIFITHDLPMLLEISDRIAIMRDGQILEINTSKNIYENPQHAYTKKLLSSFPSLLGERGGFVRSDDDQSSTAADSQAAATIEGEIHGS